MKNSNGLLLAGAALVAAIVAKRNRGASGIGGVLWDYALMECEQKGIDLSKITLRSRTL